MVVAEEEEEATVAADGRAVNPLHKDEEEEGEGEGAPRPPHKAEIQSLLAAAAVQNPRGEKKAAGGRRSTTTPTQPKPPLRSEAERRILYCAEAEL